MSYVCLVFPSTTHVTAALQEFSRHLTIFGCGVGAKCVANYNWNLYQSFHFSLNNYQIIFFPKSIHFFSFTLLLFSWIFNVYKNKKYKNNLFFPLLFSWIFNVFVRPLRTFAEVKNFIFDALLHSRTTHSRLWMKVFLYWGRATLEKSESAVPETGDFRHNRDKLWACLNSSIQ